MDTYWGNYTVISTECTPVEQPDPGQFWPRGGDKRGGEEGPGVVVGSFLNLIAMEAPPSPAAGSVNVFHSSDDGEVYIQNSDGVLSRVVTD